MAFIRKKTKVYPWPVQISKPSETKAGEFDITEFTGKFIRLSRSELDSFESATEFEALKKVLVGWKDVNEEDGTSIEFTDKALEEFSEDIDFVAGVLDAFKKFYANAQVKN
jgi:hypothetical protein